MTNVDSQNLEKNGNQQNVVSGAFRAANEAEGNYSAADHVYANS